jgi:hypothetical protein
MGRAELAVISGIITASVVCFLINFGFFMVTSVGLMILSLRPFFSIFALS